MIVINQDLYINIVYLAFILAIFLFLVILVLPLIFNKTKYNIKEFVNQKDKLIKNNFINGETFHLYAPTGDISKSIPEYVLINAFESNYLMCKLSDDIDFINIDVLIFSSKKTLLNCINYQERTEGNSQTKLIPIPRKANRVVLILKGVNEEKFPRDIIKVPSKFSSFMYALLNAALSLVYLWSSKKYAIQYYMTIEMNNLYVAFYFVFALIVFIVTMIMMRKRKQFIQKEVNLNDKI